MGTSDRIRRIFDRAGDVDRIVVRTATEPFLDPAFFYVTGLEAGLFERSSAILAPDGSVEVLVPALEETIAEDAGLDATAYEDGDDHDARLAKAVGAAERIGYNGRGLPVDVHREMADTLEGELVDVGEAIAAARQIKDADEVERIRAACDIASDVAREFPDLLEPGATEAEVAAEVEHRMRAAGASGPAFGTIVAFGAGSAEPHHTTGSTRLEAGDLALVDFGAVVRRYRSDLTRTFVLGEPTDRQVAMVETVLAAQEAAIDAIGPDVAMEAVDRAARDVVEGSPFADRFIHSTGHGLGLATHDGGALAEGRDEPLEAGMVFTVEPGVYVPGEGGVRIEDDVVVTDDGCEVLTDAPRGLDASILPV